MASAGSSARAACRANREAATLRASVRAVSTRRKPTDDGAESDGSDDESSDEDSDSEEEDEEDGIDIDELLQKDEDVFKVEKLLEWRSAEGGGREFLVKWKGFSAKETTWEPEANVLEKGMIKAVLKKPEFGKRAAPQKKAKPVESAQAPPPPPPPEPTRARSSRAGAQAASEAARRANQLDAASDDEEASEESGEEEAVHPPHRHVLCLPHPARSKRRCRRASASALRRPHRSRRPRSRKASPSSQRERRDCLSLTQTLRMKTLRSISECECRNANGRRTPSDEE